MSVLAALCVGVACTAAAGALMGTPLEVRPWRSTRSAPADRQAWLQQAGIRTTPARVLGASAGAGACAALAVTAVTGSVLVGIVPALAVAALPRAYLARRRRMRLRELHAAWPDALRDLLASISGGRSLTQAVAEVARHGPAPLRSAFARFPEMARVLGTGPALELVKEELADPTSDRVLEVLLLAHERGGAIVRAVLEDLTDATARDVKLLDALETEGLEMRINTRAVVVLPWIVLVMLTARPGPFRDFYQSAKGAATLCVAAAMTFVGVVLVGRLGREQTEPRVFVRAEGR
jgi:tight adherence protein B